MSRPPIFRARFEGELVVDNFAGGGGASTGIEAALGRPVDLAINHDPIAIAMHRANHPETRHFCENITEVDPREAAAGRPVGLAWFSPDCTHFSRAKGTKPRKKEIRGLAWVVIRWAKTVRPRVIVLENVEEFQTWGPLLENGRPDKARAGETFDAWTRALAGLGYEIEFRSLVAADYGTPTTRKRLFLIARCDRQPIVWPDATHHQDRGPRRWRPAAEVIDWSLPCPSIFERKRPLKPATLRRIAAGIRRYVVETASPFIISHYGQSVGRPLRAPVPTITAGGGGHHGIVIPTLIQTGYGERPGQSPRVLDLEAPLGTVVAGGAKHGLVAAFLSKHYTGVVGQEVDRTLGTVTAKDHHALTAAFLTKYYGTSTGADVRTPLPTVTAGGGRGGGHLAEVRAFLVKYYGAAAGQQQGLFGPLHTVTTKARFGLVMVHGQAYQIADIGMRMLQPHELFAAQGFPGDYEIRPRRPDGKRITKTQQIALAGNSVCPPIAHHLVNANAFEMGEEAMRA